MCGDFNGTSALLEEVSGCSARLVRTLVGGSAPSASASPSAAPPSTPVPPSPRIEDGETAFTQALVTIIYEYLSVGKPQAITNWLAALQGVRRISVLSQRAGLLLWQVKLISRAAHFLYSLSSASAAAYSSGGESLSPMEVTSPTDSSCSVEPNPLVSAEQALSLSKRLEMLTDSWLEEVSEEVVRYLRGERERQYSAKCAFTLVMRDLPLPLYLLGAEDLTDPLTLLAALQKARVPSAAIPPLIRMLFSSA
ncbi:hypothetical protein C7M84_007627 [Penaeus vannamei]|uniref:Anaphase-promoting complex subunit 1 C-terminal domain-containing protein n=1 Tax=Penaeus vannamei TaxID=6689 RepID=A0A423TBW1_PENVA|nr:hypothetical protein C7M84_007627 [Penaeus vannamei]